jgi:hypothetical protein
MATMTRTDIHRPSAVEFDPANYEVLAFADFHETDGHRPVQVVNAMLEQGYSFRGAPHGSGQCSHCGTRLRYAALMGHEATKTLMYVGETCLDNRFSATAAEFQAMRKAAAAKAEETRRLGKAHNFYAEHPEAVYLSYAHNIGVAGGEVVWTLGYDSEEEFATEAEAQAAYDALPERQQNHWNAPGYTYKRGTTWREQTRMWDKVDTLNDMSHKIERYGSLSDNALAYAMKIMTWLDEADQRLVARQAEAAAKAAAGIKVVPGRQVLTGEITKIAWKSNDFGGAWKITVALENGTKVWGSLPSALEPEGDVQDLVGKTITMTATVEAGDDDPTFGFFKRPVKGSIN